MSLKNDKKYNCVPNNYNIIKMIGRDHLELY